VAETGEPYAYTGDDPLNATDPLGLKPSLNAIDEALIKHGVKVKGGVRGGNFPERAKPDEILYRENEKGITSYQVYDSSGNPVKRVDLQGAAHGDVDTPHVVEYEAHAAPNGQTFYKPSSKAVPATSSEIPTQSVEQSLAGSVEQGSEGGLWGDISRGISAWWNNGGPGESGEDG
jgi:hypothetical protein